MRVAVTGGSGKLGRSVVRRLSEDGPRRHQPGPHGHARTRVSPRWTCATTARWWTCSWAWRTGTRGSTRWCIWPPSRRPGHAPDAATFENNMQATYNVFQAARRAGIKKDCLRVQRDGAGTAVRRRSSLYTGGRGIPGPAGKHLLPGEAPGGADGHPAHPLGSGAEHHRPALLERDGPGGLRGIPRLRRRRQAAQVEPLGLHRRPGRRAGGGPRPRARQAGVRGVHHRQRGHRDEPLQRQPRGGGVPGRARW